MTRRIGLLSGVVAVWLSAHLVAETRWTKLGGEGFVLRGQVSNNTLTAVACDLETAAKAFGRSTFKDNVPQVVAVGSARSIREWVPQFNERGRGNPLGAYWHGLYGDHIVVRVDASPAERLRRVLHEYAHFVTHVTHPEPAPWLDEGISEIWEHAAISPTSIEIGRPVAEHLKRLRSQKDWIPVRELLAANAIPTRTNAAWTMFYAESWALAHHVMFEKGGEIQTDEALRAYVSGPMGAAVTISTVANAGGCTGQTTYINVSPLEALLDRAQALSDGERPDAALPLLREALVLNPDNAQALEVIGFVHFTGNRPAESASVFDRVIASGKGSYISYYYRAVLAGPIPERSGGSGPVPQLEYLRKALALNPGFPPAVQRLKELTGGKEYLAAGLPAVRQ